MFNEYAMDREENYCGIDYILFNIKLDIKKSSTIPSTTKKVLEKSEDLKQYYEITIHRSKTWLLSI